MYARLAFPDANSPLSKVLALDQLSVKGGIWDQRPFDSVSNTLLVNHNVWVYLDAFQQANDLAEQRDVDRVPKAYLDCIAVIEDLFSRSSWKSAILQNRTLLDQVAPNRSAMV